MEQSRIEKLERDYMFARIMKEVYCLLFWGVFLCGLFVIPNVRESERNKAIEAGVAEWTVDSKTGVKLFQYRPSREPEAK